MKSKVFAALVALWLGAIGARAASPPENPASSFAHFPDTFSPDLPFDVDPNELKKLNLDKQLPEAQRLFDIFAGQLFLAANWPAKPNGSPDTSKDLGDSTTPRVWMGWMPNEKIFQPNGEKPPGWDSASALSEPTHYLWRLSKLIGETRSQVNELDESNQGFTGPLVDQNGNFVRYESYMNQEQYDYIVQNTLDSQEGQEAFLAQQGKLIDFPVNNFTARRRGSLSVKLAWKELGPK